MTKTCPTGKIAAPTSGAAATMLMGAATTTTALAEALKRLAGEKAKLGRVWPHRLRHSGGYYLDSQAHGP